MTHLLLERVMDSSDASVSLPLVAESRMRLELAADAAERVRRGEDEASADDSEGDAASDESRS